MISRRLVSGSTLRSAAIALAQCALLLTSACKDDSTAPARADDDNANARVIAVLTCTASASGVSCDDESASSAAPTFDRVIGGQNTYVRLYSSYNYFDSSVNQLYSKVDIINLTDQPLGTTDGVNVDPDGVRVFFHALPTNGVTILNQDGTATFTGSNQPYFQYPQILSSGGSTRGNKTWLFQLPSSSTTFTFQVYVTARQPNEAAPVGKQPSTFASLVSGPSAAHMCGFRANGKLYCWGANNVRQIGDGSYNNNGNVFPTEVIGNITFTTAVRGQASSCGLNASGVAYCWGSNTEGTLGNGTAYSGSTSVPTAVIMPSGITFSSLYGSNNAHCALTASGQGYCWGFGDYDKLGTGTGSVYQPTPMVMPSGESFSTIGMGGNHGCALSTTSNVYCWGYGGDGALGDGSFGSFGTPHLTPSPLGVTFTDIEAAWRTTCGLTTTGTVYCWGYDYEGAVGNGSPGQETVGTPTLVTMPSGVTFTALAAHGNGFCALAATTGRPYCWGSNALGEVGNNTTSTVYQPTGVVMPSGVSFVSIVGGERSNCGLTAGGAAYCWGHNEYGGLGLGSRTPIYSAVPVAVQSP